MGSNQSDFDSHEEEFLTPPTGPLDSFHLMFSGSSHLMICRSHRRHRWSRSAVAMETRSLSISTRVMSTLRRDVKLMSFCSFESVVCFCLCCRGHILIFGTFPTFFPSDSVTEGNTTQLRNETNCDGGPVAGSIVCRQYQPHGRIQKTVARLIKWLTN